MWLKSRERDFHQLLLTNLVLRSSLQSAPIIEEQLQELSQIANAWVGTGSRQRKSPSNGSPLMPPKDNLYQASSSIKYLYLVLTSYKLTLMRWIPLSLAIWLKIVFAKFTCIFTHCHRCWLPFLYITCHYDYSIIYLFIYFCLGIWIVPNLGLIWVVLQEYFSIFL